MLAPSKATPSGRFPTRKVPRIITFLARIFVTVSLPPFVTQMLAPSKAMPLGLNPTGKVPRVVPSLARSLVTVLLPALVNQMLVPSKATPSGPSVGKVPRVAPLLARSLVTVLLLSFVTQILAPSKATPNGSLPTGNCVVRFALYQCKIATCRGFSVELATPRSEGTCARDSSDKAKTIKTASRMDFDTIHLLQKSGV